VDSIKSYSQRSSILPSISQLPPELTGVWQIVDLAGGQDLRLFAVQPPGSHEERHVGFSRAGLLRLKRGLDKAGLDPRFFAWPPEREANRAPYRGLKPLEAADAGIFFGRDAPIVEAIDRLRGLGAGASPRLFVILGASGAGKSSFLRAGLLPRLARDDVHFLPLSPIRPEGAAIAGENGFLNALAASMPMRTRAELRAAVQSGAEALRSLLAEFVAATMTQRVAGEESERPPAIVIAVDQAEELFRAEGREENDALLATLGGLAAFADPAVIVIFAIRSDAYDALEHAKQLEGLRQVALPLLPMPRGAYVEVIEGPARRLEQSGGKLAVDPRLTERLLADIESGGGSDALPLLAFTLEQLYLVYHQNSALSLADYVAFGGLKGAIDAAVSRALRRADADPRIPKDRDARLSLLHRGFIPWLAGVDPESRSPRRNIARRSDIPTESAPLIDLLIEERLLSIDTRVDHDASGQEIRTSTIEPAHEALLRQWGILEGWLVEDFGILVTLEALKRSVRDWDANARDPAWLSHREGRLAEAHSLLQQDQVARRLDPLDLNYMRECAQRERQDAAQKHRTRRQRLTLLAALAVLGLILALASPRIYAKLIEERAIAGESMRTDLVGQIVAYAVVDGGLEADTANGYQTSPYTTPLLQSLRNRDALVLAAIESVHAQVLALTNGSQRPFLSTSMNGDVYLWRQPETRRKRAIVLSVDNPGAACDCKLNAPIHDGDGVYGILRDAGYSEGETVRLHNQDKQSVFQSIASACVDFADRRNSLRPIPDNSLFFFFFSGHGVSIDGERYIVPVLGDQISPTASAILERAIPLRELENRIASCASASIIVIDTHFPPLKSSTR
jgi:hypothetical protein